MIGSSASIAPRRVELKRVLGVSGMYAVGSSPAEFAAFLDRDYRYQEKLMEELGLKVK